MVVIAKIMRKNEKIKEFKKENDNKICISCLDLNIASLYCDIFDYNTYILKRIALFCNYFYNVDDYYVFENTFIVNNKHYAINIIDENQCRYVYVELISTENEKHYTNVIKKQINDFLNVLNTYVKKKHVLFYVTMNFDLLQDKLKHLKFNRFVFDDFELYLLSDTFIIYTTNYLLFTYIKYVHNFYELDYCVVL